MSLGLSNLTNTYFQDYVYRQSKVAGQSNNVDFNSVLSAKGTGTTEKLQRDQDTNELRVEEYKKYLEIKYGKVTVRSVGKDRASLDRIGKSMNGHTVVIAQNILEEMSNNPEKADYYEKKIDYFFNKIPEYTAYFAAKGLTHEPGGVIIHEDGTVTYIGGCSDSPERVAQVEAENKEKREKEAEQRKERLERSQEAEENQRHLIESYSQKQVMEENLINCTLDTKNLVDTNVSNLMISAVASYENTVNMYSESVIENSKE